MPYVARPYIAILLSLVAPRLPDLVIPSLPALALVTPQSAGGAPQTSAARLLNVSAGRYVENAADLIAVQGEPPHRHHILRQVEFVVKGGVIVVGTFHSPTN